MSPGHVSVMLSLTIAASVAGLDAGKVGGRGKCTEFVEQPSKCREAPGCKVENEWNCVAEELSFAWAKVWLQHPKIIPHAGGPPVSFPDEQVIGMHVSGDALRLWKDVSVAKFPEFLKETNFHPVEEVQKGGGLRFECPDNHDHVPCDFFVVVFGCGGHCGEQVDGGLPQLLTVTNGWEPRSCGPMMRVREEVGFSDHKMKIFRARVPAGTSMETPRVQRTAHFIGVFSSVGETRYCPVAVKSFTAESNCVTKCPFNFD